MANYKNQGYNAYIIQYFVLGYQEVKMECGPAGRDAYGSYRSLPDAKLACDSDNKCWGVYHESCPYHPKISLCPHSALLDRSSACLYLKTSNQFLFTWQKL